MNTPILTEALELHALGYSVIPIRADGSKAPALNTWKQYTQAQPTVDELHSWFGPNSKFGMGIIQGTISGNAELTEIEGRAIEHLPELTQLARDTGLGDLWNRITSGWLETSPSGGMHFHYRLADMQVPGNQKIARGADKQVLAETRGEGGQVVAAPTPGHCHETGKPWIRIIGGPATAPTITAEEREAFHAILATLDQTPEPTTTAAPTMPAAPRNPDDGISPLDDYENKTDWADILIPAGWTLATTRGDTRYWTRPGKTWGFSATTGHADDRDRLFVFTSSTDFAQEIPYTKPGAYALLHHNSDHNAAAKALHDQGFGERRKHPRSLEGPDTFFNDIIGDTPWTAPAATVATSTSTTQASAGSATAPTSPTETETVTATITSYEREVTHRSATDDGNALRLIDTHKEVLRYCPQRTQWLTWDGHKWTWDEAGRIYELARGISRNLPEGEKQEDRHKHSSLSRRGIEAMVGLAKSDHRTVVHLNQLDAEPYELNTPTGVVNLKTGQITAPNPAKLHTRSTTVGPDFNATPHRWLTFLADTFAGDPDLTTYVQRLIGLSLVGTVLEQVLPFAFGAGANGKTTLAGAIQRIIGIGDHGYSISAPATMLLNTRNEAHPTEIARLSGARLVITSELEDGQSFAEAKVKNLTGRDVISGRFMGKDWFSFTPTHTLWLLANHQPNVKAGGPAFWRRVRMLGFEHTVPAEKRIADLEDRLVEDEGPAILAWAIQGAADYFAEGLPIPASVEATTSNYEADQDTVGRFVSEACDLGDPNAQHMNIRTPVLRAAYESWCKSEGEEPVSARALTQQLRARYGVESTRSSVSRYYSGIRLKDVSQDAQEPPAEPSEYLSNEGW